MCNRDGCISTFALPFLLYCARGRKLGWDTLRVARLIADPSMANDPRIVKIVKEMQKASDDYDRAMIASDSGIGRSG